MRGDGRSQKDTGGRESRNVGIGGRQSQEGCPAESRVANMKYSMDLISITSGILERSVC